MCNAAIIGETVQREKEREKRERRRCKKREEEKEKIYIQYLRITGSQATAAV